jgi:uncharacterized protein YkwD
MLLLSSLGISFLTFFSSFFTQAIVRQPVFASQIHESITPSSSMQQLVPTAVPSVITANKTQAPGVLSEHEQLFIDQINAYRQSLGLSSVKTNEQTCSFAKMRAQEIATDFSHTGFFARVKTNTLPYTSYALVTENIAEAPDYQTIIKLWKNSPEHAANMRSDTPYVCVEQYENYYAYEGLRVAK